MKKHGNTGNTYAAKPDDEKSTSQLQVRCKSSEKSAWVKAASGKKLSQWVIDTLNEKAEKSKNNSNK